MGKSHVFSSHTSSPVLSSTMLPLIPPELQSHWPSVPTMCLRLTHWISPLGSLFLSDCGLCHPNQDTLETWSVVRHWASTACWDPPVTCAHSSSYRRRTCSPEGGEEDETLLCSPIPSPLMIKYDSNCGHHVFKKSKMWFYVQLIHRREPVWETEYARHVGSMGGDQMYM